MKIINISHTDKGGAGMAVSRTHLRLKELGYNSVVFLADDFIEEKNRRSARLEEARKRKNPLKKILERLESRISRLALRFNIKTRAIKNYDKIVYYSFISRSELSLISIKEVLEIVEDGDIIILYWLGNGVMNSSN